MSQNCACVNCFNKRVVFKSMNKEELSFQASQESSPPSVISPVQATRLLRQGCMRFLGSLVSPPANGLKVEDIEVVEEFGDVFLEDLPRLPPDREVEFAIDLTLRTAPISKAPYRIAPVELNELKDQLQKLLEKGFIAPVCPHGVL